MQAQSEKFLVNELQSGDINHDGTLDISDVLCMIDYILRINTSDFDESVSDLNKDGNIDISDVLLLVDWILHNENETDESLNHPNVDILFPTVK